jgi:Flp pilus assembly protein TadD
VVALLQWGASRRWSALGLATVLSLPYVLWATHPPPDLEPEHIAEYYRISGVTWLQRGEEWFAVLHFREAVRLEPGHAPTRLQLGQALMLSGLPEDALLEIEEAGRQMPHSGEPLLVLGEALLATGRREEARSALREAIAREPVGSPIRQHSELLLGQSANP